MTKWEYSTIPLLTHATKAILDQWGADGWELVQVIPGPTGSENLVAYLKRPIEEAPAVQNGRAAALRMNEAVVGTCGKRTRDHGLVHIVKQKVGPGTSRCRAQPCVGCGQRARRARRSTSRRVTARPSRRIQPRDTKSARDLFTV